VRVVRARLRGGCRGARGARGDRTVAVLTGADKTRETYGLYKNKEGEGRTGEDLAFDLAGELLRETYLPPKVSASLYRAVAKIPGIVLVKNSVDAVGRHGIAVGYVGKDKTGRDELIFGKKSFDFLGTRELVLKDARTNPGQVCDGVIKAGSVTGTNAILKRAVVDKAGERP